MSTVSRSRVELSARLTSPSAVSSSTERVSVLRPRLEFLEQPHVLDRDHRLVGEGRDQLDLLVGEGPDLGPPHHDGADEDALPEHRDAQDRPEARDPLSLELFKLAIRQDVKDLDRPMLKADPPTTDPRPGRSSAR